MKSAERVLIVEDQEVFATSLRDALAESMGAVAIQLADTVAGGREALQKFRPELLLLDLGLPDGSGFELLDLAAARVPRPVIVIVTIFDDDEHLFEAIRRGADGYILKEESGKELVRLLCEILDGRPPLSGSVARRILRHLRRGDVEPDVSITDRELEILKLLARGATVASAALEIGISAHTVQHHVKSLYRKLNVHSRAELTRAAMDLGLV